MHGMGDLRMHGGCRGLCRRLVHCLSFLSTHVCNSHFFRISARNFKPVTHLRTLDMFGSERHFGFSSILQKAAFLLSK